MKKILYNILGSPRSGTSLTAKILSESGVFFGNPDKLGQAEKFNPMGYFENSDIKQILTMISVENNLYIPVSKNIHTSCEGQMRTVLKELDESTTSPIGIKVPLMCCYRKLWTPVFLEMNCHEKIIAIFRHPYESTSSFYKMKKEQLSMGNINVSISTLDLEFLRWFSYNVGMLEAISELGPKHSIIIHHQDYFDHPNQTIKKIMTFMNMDDSVKDFPSLIDTKLKRYDHKQIQIEQNELIKVCNELYQFLIQLANGTSTLNDNIVNNYKNQLEQLLDNPKYQINHEQYQKENPAYFLYMNKIKCKLWMSDKKKAAETLERYFICNHIRKISIYGNGDLAKELFPIISGCHSVTLANIYDQSAGIEISINDKSYKVQSWKEDAETSKVDLIVNTIFYYETVVSMLEKSRAAKQIISLYDLLQYIEIDSRKNI